MLGQANEDVVFLGQGGAYGNYPAQAGQQFLNGAPVVVETAEDGDLGIAPVDIESEEEATLMGVLY
jgi:hypothetical protein